MPIDLSRDQVTRLRLRAQRLLHAAQPASLSPAQLLEAVAGVQAQDLPAALLAVRVRSAGLTAAEVERARREGPFILQTWCLRGTLHLISRADAAWLLPLLAPDLITGDRRRMAELGWDEERIARGLALLQAALAEHGGLARPEVVQLLAQAGLPSIGQAPIHLIYRAALELRLCIGPERGKQTFYLPYGAWAGPARALPREAALAELARRYLAAFGPAAPADLAAWSGLKLAEARAAWRRIEPELTALETPLGTAWLLSNCLPWLDEPPTPAPLVRLLPWFDNLLLGYASRDWICPPAFARRINPGGGLIHPALLVDGAVRGTWKLARRRKVLEVQLAPFEPLDPALTPAIKAETDDISRFLSEPVILTIESA